MTHGRNPFTRTGALRLNHPLFRGRAAELSRLEQACLADLDFFLLVYGGRQNGKTTVLLRLEALLREQISAGVRVCRVDFQSLPRASSADAYRHLARTVARVLPGAPQPPDTLDAPTLGDFLEDALAGDAVARLVLLLDELGTLPNATREDLAHVLRALHTRRLGSAPLAKAQFVLAGGIELYNLAVVEASALRNVCEIVRLGDLGEREAVALVADGLALVGVDAARGAELGAAVYARVGGHPYLTQRLGELLADRHLAGGTPDTKVVEDLAWELLEGSDPLLEHLRRGVADLGLEDAARRLLSASQRTSRTDDGTERLDLLGLARRAGRHWVPRSPLFAVALAEWLGRPLPPGATILEAALAVQEAAGRHYLEELRLEHSVIAQPAPNAPTLNEQVRLQRRANELADEIARIEALQRAAQPSPRRARERPIDPARLNLSTLRALLERLFNTSELRTLCFDLGIDYENLGGDSKADKARELIAYAERHQRLPELLDRCRSLRPQADWSVVEDGRATAGSAAETPAAVAPASAPATAPAKQAQLRGGQAPGTNQFTAGPPAANTPRAESTLTHPTAMELPAVGDIFTGKVLDTDQGNVFVEVPRFAQEQAIGVIRTDQVGGRKYRVGNTARVEVDSIRTLKNGRVVLELKPAAVPKTTTGRDLHLPVTNQSPPSPATTTRTRPISRPAWVPPPSSTSPPDHS